jgi:hypothetical protein
MVTSRKRGERGFRLAALEARVPPTPGDRGRTLPAAKAHVLAYPEQIEQQPRRALAGLSQSQ